MRFQSTFLGSAAIAGVLPVSALQISDKRFPFNDSLYIYTNFECNIDCVFTNQLIHCPVV